MNKPLNRLNSAARRLSLQTTDERVPVEGPIEFRTLAESFNRMMERLGQSERERNLMLGGISHDLRTPLSKIRLAIEMIDEKAPDPDLKAMIVRQIEVMDGMLAQFLDFARGIDEEEPVVTQPDAMVAELCADTSIPEVRFVERAGVSISAKPLALRRAVQNLLQNAIKYGAMPVELRTVVSDGAWTVEVLDHGAGLGSLDGSKAVEPFVRGDEARGGTQAGTGLGLAIVARIAQAHGGKLDLTNAPGKGVRARLSLPLQR
jgi:two-component system osmolarity sensor histidine kinase EnvZ